MKNKTNLNKNIKYFYDNYLQSLNLVSKNRNYDNVNDLVKDVQKHYESFLLRKNNKNYQKFYSIVNEWLYSRTEKILPFTILDFKNIVYSNYSSIFFINNIFVLIYRYFNKINPKNQSFYKKFLNKKEKGNKNESL